MGKKIAIVGAGPGGLTAAMILAKRGYDVEVFEKEPVVGGRNAELRLGDFRFDIGPTFLMMKFVLDKAFAEAATPAPRRHRPRARRHRAVVGALPRQVEPALAARHLPT